MRVSGTLPGGVRTDARAYYRQDRLALAGAQWSQARPQVQQVGGVEWEGQVLLGGGTRCPRRWAWAASP